MASGIETFLREHSRAELLEMRAIAWRIKDLGMIAIIDRTLNTP